MVTHHHSANRAWCRVTVLVKQHSYL